MQSTNPPPEPRVITLDTLPDLSLPAGSQWTDADGDVWAARGGGLLLVLDHGVPVEADARVGTMAVDAAVKLFGPLTEVTG